MKNKLLTIALTAACCLTYIACDDNKDEFLKIMKQCPEVYPVLTNLVKTLLTLYLREPMRKAQEAKEETKEEAKEDLSENK